jgi:cardiolipin synthase
MQSLPIQHVYEGLNLEPGDADDGWVHPPPTRLDDGTLIHLLKDGEALRAAFDAIAVARKRVCAEVYILRDDATGHAFVDLLCRKSRDDRVPVFLIVDAFGSDHPRRRMFRRLRGAGVRVAEFHPYLPWECRFSWRPWHRDHRKLLIVDDIVGGLGGLNIGDEYAGKWIAGDRANMTWLMRDNAIGLIGPATRVLHRCFARTWRYIHRGGPVRRAMLLHGLRLPSDPKGPRLGKQRHPREPDAPAIPVMNGQFALLASVPTLVSPLRTLLHHLLATSKTSIRMIMAYFAPDDELVRALCLAAQRGVKVELIFASLSDWHIMRIAARSFYRRLIDAGVAVYERRGAVLHAKTLCVDNHLTLIGSTNLDYRSIEFNLELSGVIASAVFAESVNALFDLDIRFSDRIEIGMLDQQPWRDRVVQWAVSRSRYVL